VTYAIAAGMINSAYALHTAHMFSHAHFLVNFMGIANAAFMIPAMTNSEMPVVASDINDLHRGGLAAGSHTDLSY
jgi:hypothetical protein